MYSLRDVFAFRPIRDGLARITAVCGWQIWPLVLGVAILLTLLPYLVR